jgi:hypothetical protein
VPRLAADENFNDAILSGLHLRIRDLDVVRAREAGLVGAPDSVVLSWAAAEGRVLLTHDQNTMIGHAYERLAASLASPGFVLVPWDLAVGQAIEDLVVLIECSSEDEWDGQVKFLPL